MGDRADVAEAVVASGFRERLGFVARVHRCTIGPAGLADLANFQFLAGFGGIVYEFIEMTESVLNIYLHPVQNSLPV